MRKSTIIAGLTTLGMAVAAYAATPAQNIEARQNGYKAIGRAFKAINDELKKDAPDVALIRANARTLDTLAGRVPRWYPAGTGPESGVKTEASPTIWTNRAGFNTAARNFAGATRGLKNAANKGDLAAIRTATGGVGPTCKGCHDNFRVKQ